MVNSIPERSTESGSQQSTVWKSKNPVFIKLMERNIPTNILSLLEQWFAVSVTCVKWCNNFSCFFSLLCGVRQGGVLSPYLFACFIDSVADKVKLSGVGCYVNMTCMSILLYADDIPCLWPHLLPLFSVF